MKILIILVAAAGLSACSSVKWSASSSGAQNDCAQNSPTLSSYNECSQQVDEAYREYEERQALKPKDDG